MSEQLSPKAIIAESIIENFEAVSSYVARQSLRDMLDENQTLRAENARLRKAMQSAYDYITNHRHGKAKAMLFDGLELYRQAALQPKEATWHAK